MPIFKFPDPEKPGHITGQNPETPERLPGHTAHVDPAPGAADNEEELGGRPAFLFAAGAWRAVTLDSSGSNLPKPEEERWRLVRYFTLGVRDAGLEGIDPEPILRGIVARGYFVWRPGDPSRTSGTSQ